MPEPMRGLARCCLGLSLVLLSAGNQSGSTDMKEIQEAFEGADQDKSGLLEFSEASRLLRSEEVSLPGPRARTQREVVGFLNRADENSDGALSADELRRFTSASGWFRMSSEEVADWVSEAVRLPQYRAIFLEHAVSGDDLPDLLDSDDDLRNLGVQSGLHRKKLRRAISRLFAGLQLPEPPGQPSSLRVSSRSVLVRWEAAGGVEAAMQDVWGQGQGEGGRGSVAFPGDAAAGDGGLSQQQQNQQNREAPHRFFLTRRSLASLPDRSGLLLAGEWDTVCQNDTRRWPQQEHYFTFLDAGLKPDTVYEYRLQAVNTAGRSGFSDSLQVRTARSRWSQPKTWGMYALSLLSLPALQSVRDALFNHTVHCASTVTGVDEAALVARVYHLSAGPLTDSDSGTVSASWLLGASVLFCGVSLMAVAFWWAVLGKVAAGAGTSGAGDAAPAAPAAAAVAASVGGGGAASVVDRVGAAPSDVPPGPFRDSLRQLSHSRISLSGSEAGMELPAGWLVHERHVPPDGFHHHSVDRLVHQLFRRFAGAGAGAGAAGPLSDGTRLAQSDFFALVTFLLEDEAPGWCVPSSGGAGSGGDDADVPFYPTGVSLVELSDWCLLDDSDVQEFVLALDCCSNERGRVLDGLVATGGDMSDSWQGSLLADAADQAETTGHDNALAAASSSKASSFQNKPLTEWLRVAIQTRMDRNSHTGRISPFFFIRWAEEYLLHAAQPVSPRGSGGARGAGYGSGAGAGAGAGGGDGESMSEAITTETRWSDGQPLFSSEAEELFLVVVRNKLRSKLFGPQQGRVSLFGQRLSLDINIAASDGELRLSGATSSLSRLSTESAGSLSTSLTGLSTSMMGGGRSRAATSDHAAIGVRLTVHARRRPPADEFAILKDRTAFMDVLTPEGLEMLTAAVGAGGGQFDAGGSPETPTDCDSYATPTLIEGSFSSGRGVGAGQLTNSPPPPPPAADAEAQQECTIGKTRKSSLYVDDNMLSSKTSKAPYHACVKFSKKLPGHNDPLPGGGAFVIRDYGTQNGTRINDGPKISERNTVSDWVVVSPGDIVTVGFTQILITALPSLAAQPHSLIAGTAATAGTPQGAGTALSISVAEDDTPALSNTTVSSAGTTLSAEGVPEAGTINPTANANGASGAIGANGGPDHSSMARRKSGTSSTSTLVVLFATPMVYKSGNQYASLPHLDWTKEHRCLESVLASCGRGDVCVQYGQANTHNLFSATLRTKALHYSGHGSADCLLFDNGYGLAQVVTAQHLTRMTKAASSGGIDMDFVFVSACFSENIGNLFVEAGVRHVVALKQDEKVLDKSAVMFTEQFYMALFSGKTVSNAFELAQTAVSMSSARATVEACKFVLLPAGSDYDHDVAIFPCPAGETCNDFVLGSQPLPGGGLSSLSASGPSHLPANPDDFTGRHVERYHLVHSILTSRLTTVCGSKGGGKTSVAQIVTNYLANRPPERLTNSATWIARRVSPAGSLGLSLSDSELSVARLGLGASTPMVTPGGNAAMQSPHGASDLFRHGVHFVWCDRCNTAADVAEEVRTALQHFTSAANSGAAALPRASNSGGLIIDRHTSDGTSAGFGGGLALGGGAGNFGGPGGGILQSSGPGGGLPHGLDFLRSLECLVVLARTDKVMRSAQKEDFAHLVGLVLERSRGVKILLVSEQPLAGVLPGIGEKVVHIDSMPLVENQRLFKKKVMNNHTYGTGSNTTGNAGGSGGAVPAPAGGGWGAGMGAAVHSLPAAKLHDDWLTKAIVNCPEYKSLQGKSPRQVCEAANELLKRIRKQADLAGHEPI